MPRAADFVHEDGGGSRAFAGLHTGGSFFVGSRLALYCCAEKRPRESAVGLYTLSECLLRSAEPVLVSTMRKTIFLFGRRHAAAELAPA